MAKKTFKKGLTNLIQSTESHNNRMPSKQNDSITADQDIPQVVKRKVTYYLEPEIVKRLKIAAARNETELSTMVSKALSEYLPKYE
jgi:predicted HicB family RNase H-like nuclease